MSLEAIAAAEGSTPEAIQGLLRNAMRKLRKRGLLDTTARALAIELDRNRATANTVRPMSRRRGRAE
jgi:hypothetical protein